MVDRSFVVPFVHRLRFTRDALSASNRVLDEVLFGGEPEAGRRPRALVVLDAGLERADAGIRGRVREFVESRRERLDAEAEPLVVPGGEVCKNDPGVLESILRRMQDAKICRRSYLIVIGGGAVLDVAGYAASIFHRGVRLVRLPSTTLSQDDSGVGVKAGVNAMGVKNLVGTFWPPWAVVNDEALLESLPDEHWRSGFTEAIKVALLKDPALFDQIEAAAGRVRARDMGAAAPIIRRSAILHLDHITSGGDPFEFLSARPLDFGHWAAHKLEQMTKFELPHGHAVGIGMLIDCTYAALLGACDVTLRDRVAACLAAIGLPRSHAALARSEELIGGLEQFREHLGGRLTVTVIRRPGDAVDLHEVDHGLMRRAIDDVRAMGA